MVPRGVVIAMVVLSLGATAAPTPVVGEGGPTPTGDGAPRQPTTVDTRPPADGNRTAPGDPLSPASGMLATGMPDAQPSAADDGALNVAYTYRRLPEQAGVVEVTMRIPATPDVDRVRLGLREAMTVVETDGVVENGSTYEWAGETPAEIVYRLRIDWSYTGNSRAEWTLLEHLSPRIRSDPAVETNETITLDGQGYVGNNTVLLGAHDVYRRQADGQAIRLVVPGNRSLRYGPRRTVDALATVSRSLEIGARDEVVHAFATPKIRTEATILEFDGFALDGNTILVDADAELAAWIHEYVHTRQAFSNAESLRWLTEGSARYYEWLLAIEAGYADWTALRGVFNRAADDDSVLEAPDTWDAESEYTKGALVLGAVDREIRAATDGERTLEDALRRINGRATRPTAETFVRAVREVGGPEAAATAERYVTTSATPAFDRDRETFRAVYGYAAPRIRTRLVGISAADGSATRSLDRSDGRLAVGRNETLRLTVRVENTGRARGLGVVTPRLSTDRLGGEYFDTTWVGWVEPNGSVTRTVTHRFDRSGDYDITWKGVRYDVRVAPDRGTASVVGLNVTEIRPDDGRITVAVTVRNDGDRPTFASVPVTVGGREAARTALVVDEGETRTATVDVEVPVSGPTTVAVGSASTTVDLSAAAVTTTKAAADRPGVGVLAVLALVALVAAVGLRQWANRRR